MKTLHLMLVRIFLPIFVVSIFLFVLVFELMDVFSNLWRYISSDVSIYEIGRIALYYLPKCVAYSLPIALLFSATYAMGIFYMNNELISVFGSCISLYNFVIPLIFIGLLLSVGGFMFEERVVIDTYKIKNSLFQSAVKQTVSRSNSNVTVTSADNRFVYQINYFNDKQQTFSGVTIIEMDADSRLVLRIDAVSAYWSGTNWVLEQCRIFRWGAGQVTETQANIYDSGSFAEDPSIFQRVSRRIDEMKSVGARDYINQLKKAGLPYQEALSEYNRKFSFALTPLIVVVIASAIGGLFRKNVLLMSLLTSLCLVVVYYVLQMIGMSLARNGYIPPSAGAWGSVVVLLCIGVGLFRLART